MNNTKEKRKAIEIQPLQGFELVNVGVYANNMQKELIMTPTVKKGYTPQRVYQLFQEGKIDMVKISDTLFVKVPK